MDSAFFTDFLFFTEIKTGVFIAILMGLFYFLRQLEKKGISFSTRMLMSTGIGLALGLVILLVGGFPYTPSDVRFIAEINVWYGLIAEGFMSLLRMLVVPLVLISIIRVIINMEQNVNLQKLTFRTLGTLIVTTVIGAIIGISLGQVFQLGVNVDLVEGDLAIREVEPIVTTILGLLPANPFASMASGAVVPIIIFASFIGMAIKRQAKKHQETIKPILDLIEAGYQVIIGIAMIIIQWMPYAVIALLANVIASRGIAVIGEVFGFTAAFYLGTLIMFIIHLIILGLVGLNPVQYIRNVMDALVLAFTSRSSLGTLPVSIEKLTTKAGLNQGTATFVGSLGANGGMNGSAGIYPALVTVMIANMVGTPIDFTFIVMLLLVIALSSFGIAGLPGAATLSVSIVLAAMGLGEFFPLMAIVVAIDPILDMGRTLINVNGTLTTAVVVGKSLNQIDEKVFYAKDETSAVKKKVTV